MGEKIPFSGMTHFNGYPIRWKKVIPLRIYSKPLLITDFWGLILPITDFWALNFTDC